MIVRRRFTDAESTAWPSGGLSRRGAIAAVANLHEQAFGAAS
jgi:hypothetical protein